MSRIVSLGSATQNIYLTDRDDFVSSEIGEESIFGKILIGSNIDIDNIAYKVSGGAVNSAISFARHNHESIVISNISHDFAGENILSKLDEENIDSSFIHFLPRKSTGCSVILTDSKSNKQTTLTHQGSSAIYDNLNEDDLDLIKPDWIYATSLNGDMHTLLRFFEKAHSIGTKIMFNPGLSELNHPKQLVGLLSDVDILLVNKSEAAKIVSGNTLSELLYRLSNYLDYVIITDSETGGIATNKAESFRFGIYEDVKVKDINGVGDAFGSGFLAHYAAGHSFKDSIVFASANAASVISKLGANTGVLTGKEKLHQMPIQLI